MSFRDIRIERLNIALHGVSSLVAEQALAGLDAELRRRLGSLHGGWQTDAPSSLRIGPLDLPADADAAAVRQQVAEGLLEALFRPSAADSTEVE
ncbi:MAG: hypothetical protein ABW170_10145 [Candidatus Thiodiazotropha sp. L084R]